MTINRLLLMADPVAGGALPPVTPPPVTPPTASPTPPKPDETGSSDLAADLMADLTKPIEPPTPTPPAAPIPAAKPAPATPPVTPPVKPAPAAPAKPTTPSPINPDDPKLTAPELRKHVKQLISDLNQTRSEKQTTQQTLEARITELNKKRFWSEDDEKEFSSKTQRLAQLESDLYGRDYAASPEYKKQFSDKINGQFKEAVDVFQSLQVNTGQKDASENPIMRPATQAEVMRLFNAPNNVERRKLAKELFGEDFQEALDMVNPMVETQKSADQAVRDKTTNYQSETKTKAETQRQQSQQVEQFVKTQTETLAEKYPDIFKASDDQPEAAALLKKGFDFVDDFASKQNNMSMDERAAKITLIRSWAAAFPRLHNDVSKLRSEN